MCDKGKLELSRHLHCMFSASLLLFCKGGLDRIFLGKEIHVEKLILLRYKAAYLLNS